MHYLEGQQQSSCDKSSPKKLTNPKRKLSKNSDDPKSIKSFKSEHNIKTEKGVENPSYMYSKILNDSDSNDSDNSNTGSCSSESSSKKSQSNSPNFHKAELRESSQEYGQQDLTKNPHNHSNPKLNIPTGYMNPPSSLPSSSSSSSSSSTSSITSQTSKQNSIENNNESLFRRLVTATNESKSCNIDQFSQQSNYQFNPTSNGYQMTLNASQHSDSATAQYQNQQFNNLALYNQHYAVPQNQYDTINQNSASNGSADSSSQWMFNSVPTSAQHPSNYNQGLTPSVFPHPSLHHPLNSHHQMIIHGMQ